VNDGDLIHGPATIVVGGRMVGRLKKLSATIDRRAEEELREAASIDQARRDQAITLGIPLRIVEMGDDYVMAFLGKSPKPEEPRMSRPDAIAFSVGADPYAIDLRGGIDLYRMSMRVTMSTAEALRRPSWLHPIARTLWVNRYGPQCPEVIPPGGAHRMLQRPSWLHPIKRTLWIHVHGPHVPEVKEVIRISSATLRTMAVIKGVE